MCLYKPGRNRQPIGPHDRRPQVAAVERRTGDMLHIAQVDEQPLAGSRFRQIKRALIAGRARKGLGGRIAPFGPRLEPFHPPRAGQPRPAGNELQLPRAGDLGHQLAGCLPRPPRPVHLPLGVRPHEDRCGRFQPQVDRRAAVRTLHAGDSGPAGERIEDHRRGGRRSERHPTIERFHGVVHDEVAQPFRIPAANEPEPGMIDRRFAPHRSSLQALGQRPDEHAALSPMHLANWPVRLARGRQQRLDHRLESRPALLQSTQSGHILGQAMFEDHRPPGVGQFQKPRKRRVRHLPALRNDDCLPSRTIAPLHPPVLDGHRLKQAIRDIVEPVAAGPQHPRRFAQRALQRRLVVHRHVSHAAAPGIVNRPVEEHVIIRQPIAEHRLAPGDVLVQHRRLAPERIPRVHLRRGVERPARPGRVVGRIDATVIEDVVRAREEQEIQFRLQLLERLAKVLRQPGAALGGA